MTAARSRARAAAATALVALASVATADRDAGVAASTRFFGRVRLRPGSWRVQAVHPADGARRGQHLLAGLHVELGSVRGSPASTGDRCPCLDAGATVVRLSRCEAARANAA